jgi:hypothetical protein
LILRSSDITIPEDVPLGAIIKNRKNKIIFENLLRYLNKEEGYLHPGVYDYH